MTNKNTTQYIRELKPYTQRKTNREIKETKKQNEFTEKRNTNTRKNNDQSTSVETTLIQHTSNYPTPYPHLSIPYTPYPYTPILPSISLPPSCTLHVPAPLTEPVGCRPPQSVYVHDGYCGTSHAPHPTEQW